MKRVVQIVLAIAILALAYILVEQLARPERFKKEVRIRELAVVERIKDIRTAEQAYKQKYQRYTGDFDTLINFILHDSLTFERVIGSLDDSVAVARGQVKREQFEIAVYDTLFRRRLSVDDVRQLPIIPYSDGERYKLAAGYFETDSKVVVPVFEARAPYKTFLSGIDEQELINLIDDQKILDRYPGIKVGSLTSATNDAGNWE